MDPNDGRSIINKQFFIKGDAVYQSDKKADNSKVQINEQVNTVKKIEIDEVDKKKPEKDKEDKKKPEKDKEDKKKIDDKKDKVKVKNSIEE